MKSIILCTSVSHGNSRRIAEAMGEVLGAKVVEPREIDNAELASYDLVGFGSGIYNLDFHRDLRARVDELPQQTHGRAFVFTTSGLPEPPFRRYIRGFSRKLEIKGYEVVGTFSCRALDTWFPWAVFGGIRKGHPDEADLAAARAFAESLVPVGDATEL